MIRDNGRGGRKYATFVLCVSLSCVFSTMGCDGHTSISGHVADPKGGAIVGATVVLQRIGEEGEVGLTQDRNTAVTDQHGWYSTGVTHAPITCTFELVITKEGYLTHREQVALGIRHEDHDVALERLPEERQPD
jgi:hypothetical protein